MVITTLQIKFWKDNYSIWVDRCDRRGEGLERDSWWWFYWLSSYWCTYVMIHLFLELTVPWWRMEFYSIQPIPWKLVFQLVVAHHHVPFGSLYKPLCLEWMHQKRNWCPAEYAGFSLIWCPRWHRRKSFVTQGGRLGRRWHMWYIKRAVSSRTQCARGFLPKRRMRHETIIPLLARVRQISCKWVYKVKRGNDGLVERARLVGRG